MANNIFGGAKPDEKRQSEVFEKVDTHSKALLTLVQRQKDLESSLDLIHEKFELLDHSSIKKFKKADNDTKSMRDDLRDLKHEIKEIKNFNMKVIKQLKLVATHDEVKKLEKYIDLWNPMEFVNRGELNEFRDKIKKDIERIVERFIEED